MALRSSFLTFLVCAALLPVLFKAVDAQGLKVGFYKKTCPKAETIVRQTVASFVAKDATVAAPLLSLHFHDCFVRGCDGSVLLDSTKGHLAEKDATPNLSLDGFDVIDTAKAAVEAACPGVVSCADIVALAARDGVVLNNGPSWQVETGRRDGRVSSASEAVANLPSPFTEISELKAIFARKGLSAEDLAALSGRIPHHRERHCNAFTKRLYNFTGKGDRDPSLSPAYAQKLRSQCPRGDETSIVEMDPGSAVRFDTSYYARVVDRKGLFRSDATLLQEKVTRDLVYQYTGSTSDFFHDFGVSMIKWAASASLRGREERFGSTALSSTPDIYIYHNMLLSRQRLIYI
ncbi:unnamed protein product [Spirodela intermedia]|uniref:Peroxidase n=1 Tax=Spirodela intermedia TaxID=51605 RepID=A0A7I8JND3_SPIIN|nr:unnamed protein product [Spirodela intermedia]CAA6671687.1 unnamed protein product [Spirodela intermedia]